MMYGTSEKHVDKSDLLEVDADEAAVAHPLDLGDRRLGVHAAHQLRRLVPLHADRVLGLNAHAREVLG